MTRPPWYMSARKEHPAFADGWVARVAVLLDGRKVDHAWCANERGGYVWVHEVDAEGRGIIDVERGIVKSRILFGRVRIVATGRPYLGPSRPSVPIRVKLPKEVVRC